MGEAAKGALGLHFDRRLKLVFRGVTITSDAGLLAFRELDEALGLSRMAAGRLADGRPGKNIQHGLLALFRQAVFGRLAGYEDVNDAERLRLDPAMRALVGHGEGLRFAASTSEMARFETELLAIEENLNALSDLPGHWVDRVHARAWPDFRFHPGPFFARIGPFNRYLGNVGKNEACTLMIDTSEGARWPA